MKRRFTLKRILLFILLVILILIARPTGFILYTWYKDPKPVSNARQGYANDAGKLSATRVDTVVKVATSRKEAEAQLSQLVKQAAAAGKKISIAGAQHSMGGHTITTYGMVIDMKSFNTMELDSVHNLLTVGAGALWSQIIPYLHQHGRSVAVMQSNNSFSVGGSISVNCHGWQPNAPPIAATVESFRLINASGAILTCSRLENTELFSLVLGGYGLFGIILDVQLRVVPNKMYRLQQYVIKSSDYIKKFGELADGNAQVGMVYGRVNINPAHFMEEAILSVFSVDSTAAMEPLKETGYTGIRRAVFRGSANSDYGKNLRWRAEKWGARLVSGKKFPRNQLINESVEVFQNTTPGYTDILHEYFIPRDSVTRFIEVIKGIIPKYKVDLLNITLRNVEKDEDCFMKYAREEVFGFVMLYNQAMTPRPKKRCKD
ncbi:FAD-binding oxidoreductase [Paraflavitalea speifideaquila]|uniref:FAD-binding oxidoreductase n=1 Tax=Paraflavitalea speifideaquila TaxID=3076558 RepID=UPI0028E1CB32|nr:FAD-binding oxidoreductase [Paraflavitalea speifideiaquila]